MLPKAANFDPAPGP